MQIIIQHCFCKENAGALQTVYARFKGPFDNAPCNAGTWRAAGCLSKTSPAASWKQRDMIFGNADWPQSARSWTLTTPPFSSRR